MLIFQLLDLERRLIWQKICFMKKCYFSLNEPPIWWASCRKNLKCYLLHMWWLNDSFIQDLAMLNIDRCGWNNFGLILFNFLDKNNDGCVTQREMKKSIRKIRNKCWWKLWISRTDFSRIQPDQPTSQEKNNAMISVFICRNSCKSQSIAIQPLDFSQVLSKKRRICLLWFWRK